MFWKFLKYIVKEHKSALLVIIVLIGIIVFMVTKTDANSSIYTLHKDYRSSNNLLTPFVALGFILVIILWNSIKKK